MRYALSTVFVGFAALAAAAPDPPPAAAMLSPGEQKFLANLRQLTFGGQNAEAYWAADGSRLIYQSDAETSPATRSSR